MGVSRGNSGMCVCFVLLASHATLYVLTGVRGHARPPEFSGNELAGFQISGVASSLMVMTVLEDGVVKGFIVWDVNVTLVSQDTSFDLPVRKAGVEGEGSVFVHRLECLEDKGVASRGIFNVMREGDVDNIDKKEQRKEGNSLVVIIRSQEEVWVMGEGIGTS